MRNTLLLLGDSTLDNRLYVPAGSAVANHLSEKITPSWAVNFRAVDGAFVGDVYSQLRRPPAGVRGVVLSVGGNDLFQHIRSLSDKREARPSTILCGLREVREDFRYLYRRLLQHVSKVAPVRAACSIYNPNFTREPGREALQMTCEAVLSLFNDVIQQEAMAADFHVIDLRRCCSASEDFANPIEPSAIGGRKIATAICDWVTSVT